MRVRTRMMRAVLIAVGALALLPAVSQATATTSPGISAAGTVQGYINGNGVLVYVAAVQGCTPGTSTFLAEWAGSLFREGSAGQSDSCSNYNGAGQPQSLQFGGSGTSGTVTGGDFEGPGSPSDPNTVSFTITTPVGTLTVPQAAPGPFQGAPGRVQPYGTAAVALQFVQQPTNSVTNQAITPAVTVRMVNSSGNPVDTSGVPITIAIGSDPGSSTLSGTVTEDTAANGVATFSNLALNNPQNNYTLTASSPGDTGATSATFDENNTQVPCAVAAPCTDTLSTANSSLTVDVGSGSTAATLSESVDVGTPQNGNPGCSWYTPPAGSVDWYEFDVQPADGKTYDRTKNVTWTVNNASYDGFEICYGAPYEFYSVTEDGDIEQAPAGTLPDGSSGYVGILAACNEIEDAAAFSPCWTNIEPSVSYTGVVANVQIPAGLPGDPAMGR